ncbi:MAG: ferritin family protein [Candidatus Aminicenantales bacterium]
MEFSTFEEIIDFAIKREEEAFQSYGEMIEMAQTPGLKKLLTELQNEEKNHKKLLENITQERVKSFNIKEVLDLKISDYLIEEPPHKQMNFQDLLIFAAKKEQKAVELYSNLRDKTKENELKRLFEFLVQQEKRHKLRLEKEYEEHVLEED